MIEEGYPKASCPIEMLKQTQKFLQLILRFVLMVSIIGGDALVLILAVLVDNLGFSLNLWVSHGCTLLAYMAIDSHS